MRINVLSIAHHRNGVAGAPFHAIIFKDRGPQASVKIGIVFDENTCVAVLDIAKLSAGDVKFGSNSWRGDDYEPYLRAAIHRSESEGGHHA